ncbi:MAG TPA: hypothetical protein VGB30_11635 [bacterium]
MDNDYLNRPVIVKLITGETLPEGILYWGTSSLAENLLWFGIPKENEVHKTEIEYHVPRNSIAYIQMEGR